jgi:hypothetical protein
MKASLQGRDDSGMIAAAAERNCITLRLGGQALDA